MKIFSQILVGVLVAAIWACSTTTGNPYNFTSRVDLSASSIAKDQLNTGLYFSTDNGKTYNPFGQLKVGQQFLVKLWDYNTSSYISSKSFYTVNWSNSSPKPANISGDSAVFTLSSTTNVWATVEDTHCAFNGASWVGAWTGNEGTVTQVGSGTFNGSNDALTITQDSSNPNKLLIANFFGDGAAVVVYAMFNTSTSWSDQTVTIPQQTTSEGGVASGSGTYDQCRSTITLNVTYNFGAPNNYTWTYMIHK